MSQDHNNLNHATWEASTMSVHAEVPQEGAIEPKPAASDTEF